MSDKIKLPNVTLAAMTSVNVYETIHAMQYSMRGIEFGDVVLITHRRPLTLPRSIRYSHTSRLDNIDKFNYKMTELNSFVDLNAKILILTESNLHQFPKYTSRFFL